MCGRAKLPDDVSEIKLDLKIDFDEIGAYQPRWNAAPTTKLPVVVSRDGQRTLTLMRWGLVPGTTQSWAQARKIGHSTFNARAEGIDTRPAFRTAWKAGRRCLVIADGYYEWRDADKQPFAVALGNRGPMTMAGLWDTWTAPDGDVVKSFAIITTTANDTLATLAWPHASHPDAGDNWAGWLGETRSVKPSSRPCSNLIPAPEWLFGRSTGASAMSATTARICLHRTRENNRPFDGVITYRITGRPE